MRRTAGEDLEADPFDVELGETIALEPRRKDAGMVVSVRLSREDARRLADLAAQTNRTVSQVCREAINAYVYGSTILRSGADITLSGAGNFVIHSNADGVDTKGGTSLKSADTIGRPQPFSQFVGDSPRSA